MRVRNEDLGFYIIIVDERGTHLLVAIGKKLLAKSTCCVDASSLGGKHLKLVVDKQGHVVGDIFLVDNCLGVVLVVRILKF